MSLLLKAFPHGRPRPRALVAALVIALVVVTFPLQVAAEARSKGHHAAHHAARHAAHHAAHHAARHKPAHKRPKPKPKPKAVGQPGRNYVAPAGSYFSYPNRGKRAQRTIRNRVLYSVQSTWGGPRDRFGEPMPGNGTIRMATWTFDDWTMARALVAAKKRGVSVQVIGASDANRGHASWRWLRQKLGTRPFRKKYPATAARWSFARTCRGSCRGLGGTAHSKYYLFNNVGAAHARAVTIQTSMNLTTFAFSGQWNQAQVSHSARVFGDYSTVFAQSIQGRAVPARMAYRASPFGQVVDYFFPRYRATAALDPVVQILNATSCAGAKAGSSGTTQIHIIQYAIYGDRGIWLAQKLRYLWNHGCGVRIIYTVASRPVLAILRNHSRPGPIPMRQSVITNGYGTIVKYNHSKWMTIVGHWGSSPAAYVTFNGSANWADLAFGDDEQMQLIGGRTTALAHLRNFATTWSQPTSHMPGYGVLPHITGRVFPTFARDVPENAPAWGHGVFRYMSPD